MKEYAIGMIETRGFIPSIEAVDAMLKSANVHIDSYQKTGSGYITVIVRGDVSAVMTAVAIGVEAARRVGQVTSHYVIPRLDKEMIKLLPKISQ